MELAVGQHHTAWNFIFVNLVDGDAGDIEAAEEVVHAFTEQCFEDLRRLKVAWVEVKVGPGRVVAQNKTSYHYSVEYHADAAPPRPYPALTKLQRKRMVAQQARARFLGLSNEVPKRETPSSHTHTPAALPLQVNTTYCYDFLDLFARSVKAELQRALDPVHMQEHELPPFAATELVLQPGSRTVLSPMARPPGSNDVGVVVWRCTYASAAYPEGRDIVLVANDITHASGSFSPAEDDVFCAAFKLAQDEGLPCVYVSANSGARIGLDEAVKAAFKAAWIDPLDPALGFEYLYLDDADYKYLRETGSSVACDPVVAPSDDGGNGGSAGGAGSPSGAVRWRLRDVPGGLGVECLQGSGAIASAASAAYARTFTLTYVTARSVGIGAYVSRLSRRIIQHADAPLILTGASALNKLLGRDVYTSNNQIGGPKARWVERSIIVVVIDLSPSLPLSPYTR